MTIGHYSITRATLIAAFTTVVGQLIAFLPSLGPDKQNLISAGSIVISAAFVLGNAIHALASSKLAPKDIEGAVGGMVRDELSKVDFNALAHDAISANGISGLEGLVSGQVQAELRRLLGQQATAPVPAVGGPISSVPVPPTV